MIDHPVALLAFLFLLIALTRFLEGRFSAVQKISALAIAMAMKWKELVTPGIIVGIFGYAVGNYAGLACAYLLRSLL